MHSAGRKRNAPPDAVIGGVGVLLAAGIGVTGALATGGIEPTLDLGLLAVSVGGPGLLLATTSAAAVLWSLRPPAVAVTAACLLVLIVTAAGAGALIGPSSTALGAAVTALGAAAAAATCAGIAGVVRERRRTRRLGWELAQAIADRESASVEQAVTRERSEMAGEIHDRLGHQLTLVAVQLGRLSIDPAMPESARDTIEKIRSATSDAAADLGETVRLLKAGSDPTPVDRSLTEVLAAARESGMQIEDDLPDGFDDELGAHTRAALERLLSEALTNAAKHAPGRAVQVWGEIAAGRAVVQVRNPLPDDQQPAPSSEHGLASVGHRIDLLKGRFSAGAIGDAFQVRASVGLDARPATASDRTATIVREEQAADERHRRRLRLAVAVPVGLAALAVIVTVVSMIYLTLGSVLPPDRYAQISVGMGQAEAERLLPAVEMLEAPRDALPHPPGASCRFYEASGSFLARDDVYRICFSSGVVSDRDVITA